MSLLGTQQIARLELSVPPAGGWYADVTLASGAIPALGPVTLTVGDLSLVGTVTRAGFDHAEQPRVVVEGGAGWGKALARGSYQSAAGVRLSTVLRDLSAAAGEPHDAPVDVILGSAFAWPAHAPRAPVRGRTVLSMLLALGVLSTWRVAPSGRTRFDAWPAAGAVDEHVRVASRDLGLGLRCVGLDVTTSGLLPGATLENVPIRRVVFRESAGELRAEIWDR